MTTTRKTAIDYLRKCGLEMCHQRQELFKALAELAGEPQEGEVKDPYSYYDSYKITQELFDEVYDTELHRKFDAYMEAQREKARTFARRALEEQADVKRIIE